MKGAPLVSAPATFEGTLSELFERFIEPNLPAPKHVEKLHNKLVEYVAGPDPAFVVRYVKGLERGTVYRTSFGDRLIPSDNAPAWWMHFVTFNQFTEVDVAEMPTHMFDVRCTPNISQARWHVAHILNVKDGNTNWRNWSRQELLRRFIRNVHPCNCFYIPNIVRARYGGDAGVIGFFVARYSERYSSVWQAFLTIAEGAQPPDAPCPQLVYGDANGSRAMSTEEVARSYRYSRLCFKADIIEPLAMDDTFEVVTERNGTFRMTKRDFYREFPRVRKTSSYRKYGVYHYPVVPRRVLKYRVG